MTSLYSRILLNATDIEFVGFLRVTEVRSAIL